MTRDENELELKRPGFGAGSFSWIMLIRERGDLIGRPPTRGHDELDAMPRNARAAIDCEYERGPKRE